MVLSSVRGPVRGAAACSDFGRSVGLGRRRTFLLDGSEFLKIGKCSA